MGGGIGEEQFAHLVGGACGSGGRCTGRSRWRCSRRETCPAGGCARLWLMPTSLGSRSRAMRSITPSVYLLKRPQRSRVRVSLVPCGRPTSRWPTANWSRPVRTCWPSASPAPARATSPAPLGPALLEKGSSVLFMPTARRVQELLAAERDLKSPRALRRLANFALFIRRCWLRAAGHRRGLSPLHLDVGTPRTPIPAHHIEPRLQRMGQEPLRPDVDRGRFRAPRAHHSAILEFDLA
jgi:hypothetical protein